MTSYKEAKSAAFISDIIRFAEELLGIKFWKTGKYSYSSHCPFHNDRKDSFRVYVMDRSSAEGGAETGEGISDEEGSVDVGSQNEAKTRRRVEQEDRHGLFG